MAYSKEFYYSETGSRARYTSKPSGRIDFKRAIAGRPDCFVSGISSREQKQKKLILADWTIRNWDISKRLYTHDYLQRLIDAGFSLYIWQAGEVKPLTDLNWFLAGSDPNFDSAIAHAITQKITPEFPEKIIEAAVTQQKLTKENTFILDKDWFEWLLDFHTRGKLGAQRRLKVSDLMSLTTRDMKLLLDIYKKTNTTIDTLICNVLSTSALKIIEKVNAHAKEVAYESLIIDGPEIKALVLQHPKQYVQPCLKNLEVQEQYDISELLSLLDSDLLSDIESMDFSRSEKIGGCFSSLKKGSRRKLTSINLGRSNITSEDVSAICSAAPNLEYISLILCKNIAGGFSDLKKGSLNKLKIARLNVSNITSDDIVALLLAAPNLEIIFIRGCKQIDDFFSSLKNASLNQLKTISFEYPCKISLEDLPLLQSIAPHLECIEIHGPNPKAGIFSSLKNGRFNKLKEIYLQGNITADDLTKLCAAAPNLEDIELHDCNAIAGIFSSLEKGDFNSLKRIVLSGNITADDLTKLRAAAPNLEAIELDDCNAIAGIFSSLERGSFKRLKRIFYEGNITVDELLILCAAAPNLEKIYVKKIIGDISFLKKEIRDKIKTEPIYKAGAGSSNSNQKFGTEAKPATQKLDANTKHDPDTKFIVNRIFCSTDGEPFPVNNYRLSLFNKATLNEVPCFIEDAFEMTLEGKPALIPCKVKPSLADVFDLGKIIEKKVGYSYAYGLHTFELNEEWQAIPSLNASEELLHYHTTPSSAAVEIQYSQHHNRYYIRSMGQKQTVGLDFLLKVPETTCLPDEIADLVKEFKSFKPGELNLDPITTQFNGKDYLAKILAQKKGACRHRAFAFGHRLQEQYPQYPMRIVTNDCHAFVEVKVENQWINCDLGGYAAILEVKEMDILNRAKAEIPPPAEMPLSGAQYDQKLQPWRNKKLKLQTQSLKEYLGKLVLPSTKKNRLVQLDSEASVTVLIGGLQAHCKNAGRPFFYLHSPEEASGLSYFIERKGNTGTITKGCGHPLAAFLTANYHANVYPILIVNYSRFNADDIVRLNTMLDTKRSVENLKIPDSVILVGVNNTNAPDCYQGSDFYSRFDKKDSNPVLTAALTEGLVPFPKRLEGDAPANVINLFHASDWKFRLLGGWVLGGGTLVFKEGLLQSALNKGNPLTIQNGLWEEPEFAFFWQQACLTGRILGEGEVEFDTRNLQINTLDGHDWELLKKNWYINENLEGEELILNSETLGNYFERFEISANKRANPAPGFIQKAIEDGLGTLQVYVSYNLGDDEWAMLLSECNNKNISLSLRCAPGVSLPGEPLNKLNPKVRHWQPSIQDHTQFIVSRDIDTTLALLSQSPQVEVIDISECSASDLLLHIRPEFKEDHLEFTETEHALVVALKAGKSVILKGNFSEELSCALTPLLLARFNQTDIKGQLILVSDSLEHFKFVPNPYTHEVSVEEKQQLIQSDDLASLDWSKPLSTLYAELQFPGSSKGLLTLENSISPLATFNPETSAQDTVLFNDKRKDLIWSVLNHSPYVYIAGLTGVGKSTFIKKELLKGTQHKLYLGEQDMKAWAKDQSNDLKILFIDEANLSAKQWSEFEGLFNTPPTILINGELIPLTSQHKVIFAGNPLSYGDERELAPFFTRHQRVVVFDPLPLAVIYEQILRPVFSEKSYASETPTLCKPMLDVYAFLHGLSTKDVLISPRELQMMALLTATYCEKMPVENLEAIAQHFAYELAKDLVPASKRDAFDHLFKRLPIKPLRLPEPAKDGFKITQSRLPAAHCLNELLELRQIRQTLAINDQQKYGGLGGVIFEGEPGVGKSELVTAMLHAHGYKKIKSIATKPEKGFYRLQASLSLAEKEDLLIRAFYAGDVVVIDEINSSPMMESLLNDLLNGQEPTSNSPEKPGHSIKPKPGFMVIGTQNPQTMAGRRGISSPLLKRVRSLEIPPYPRAEMVEILHNIQPDTAVELKQKLNELVDAYERNLALAEKEHKTPPTFRDVMRVAKLVIEEHTKKLTAIGPTFFKPYPMPTENNACLSIDELTVSALSIALAAGAASLTILCLGPVGLGILGAAVALNLAIALSAVMITGLLAACVGLGLIACSDEKEELPHLQSSSEKNDVVQGGFVA